MTRASAPGKFILFGEHAVVYGQPAIAFPLHQLRAAAQINVIPDAPHGCVRIHAPDIDYQTWLHEADEEDPLRKIVQLTLEEIRAQSFPAFEMQVSSEIPVSSGLGSGAAVSTAIVRALSQHFEHPLELERQSELVYEVEKIHHGTPSGIDNTVIVYNRPIFYIRGCQPEYLEISGELTFILADTNLPSNTGMIVGNVRKAWEQDRPTFDTLFREIGQVTERAKSAIAAGDVKSIGMLMDENQELLEQLGVSSETISVLLATARDHGAYGAKLSGAGVGGIIITLVQTSASTRIVNALHDAGAIWTGVTKV
jgi:mevalonate kinase